MNAMLASRPANSGSSTSQITVTQVPSPVLPTKTLTTNIQGHSTTVIVQSFADRIFITITQLNKFGCLYQADTSNSPSSFPPSSSDDAPASSLPPSLPNTTVNKLVGTEPSPAHTALYQLYVSQIASIVRHTAGGQDGRPLVVSLALKSSTTAEAGEDSGVSKAEAEVWDQDEAESVLMASEEERKRFIGIMQLVQQCRVW